MELFGMIALLIFAVIGLGFTIGAIIVWVLYSVPNIKANREIAKAEAKNKFESKLEELRKKALWVDLNTVDEYHTCEHVSDEEEFSINLIGESIEDSREKTEIEETIQTEQETVVEEDRTYSDISTDQLSEEDKNKLEEILKGSL